MFLSGPAVRGEAGPDNTMEAGTVLPVHPRHQELEVSLLAGTEWPCFVSRDEPEATARPGDASKVR